MTEKRYYAHKHLLQENKVHDKICHNFMSLDETVEHMNNQYWKYKQLKHECNYLQNRLDDFINIQNENEQLKSDLKDCKKLKNKRLNKIRNHRAVIEDLGGSIRAYKGKLGQANEKIEKIKEAMEDTGALTKRQLEEILND